MTPKVPLKAALVVGATMLATVGAGLLFLRSDPPAPPPASSQPAPQPRAPAPPPAAEVGDGAAPEAASGSESVTASVPSSPANARPCRVTHDGDGPVAEACRRGGQDGAKRFMKAMVNRTKDRPDRVTCDTCHENVDDFTLHGDARSRLADLLASLGPPR